MLEIFKKILEHSKNRMYYLENIDNKNWYVGNKTFLDALEDEIKEVKNEVKENNEVYLEDELGDILWAYSCLLYSLENEKKISSVEKVFERCYKKFSERILPTGDNIDWKEIKKKQKEKLLEEHNFKYNKN